MMAFQNYLDAHKLLVQRSQLISRQDIVSYYKMANDMGNAAAHKNAYEHAFQLIRLLSDSYVDVSITRLMISQSEDNMDRFPEAVSLSEL